MLKQIDKALPLPKYYQISESIKQKIASGELTPGSRIPTYQALTEYFKTTMPTICNAVRQLESDGYIYKTPRKGMFVSHPATANSKTDTAETIKKVGLAMHTRGDLYQNLVETLVHDLGSHDIFTIPLPAVSPNTDFSLDEKNLKKYIAKGLDVLVMDGTRRMQYKLLHKYRANFRQLNFLMHYNSTIAFPDANIITFDYAKAGRLAAEHLLKTGREKFIFFTFDTLTKVEHERNGCRCDDECNDMITLSGMKAVIREAGLPESCITVIRDTPLKNRESNMIYFTEILKQGPWGIFTLSDFRAVQIYKDAIKLGLDFKKNISIVGCYNTSWTEVLHPTLTSISVNETEIAHVAADCIVNRKTGQRIVVDPKLVVRET
ncbi:MAG: GntR family transcriptional regulator [Victivallaceae bacterium]